MAVIDSVKRMKKAAPLFAASDVEMRNHILKLAKEGLLANQAAVFAANEEDCKRAEAEGIAPAVLKRLRFDEHKLDDCIKGIDMLTGLEDPVGRVTLNRELDEGLVLKRVTCPIGVIGVIFEARPDALVQISSLCIKSGNCAILKGGKETRETNRLLFSIMKEAVVRGGAPEDVLLQAESHSEIDELLACDRYVDLLIPRGSNAFVQHIMNSTKIPVMGHADGICHIYVDQAADFTKAIRVIVDAKTQYTAACNAVETLLVNRKIAKDFLPELKKVMEENGVLLKGTKEVSDLIGTETIDESDFKEYLSLTASVKLVEDVREAAEFINAHGSHHTDCILTEDDEAAAVFMSLVDSAGVYRNVSTRFADGFRYGFGAEVGISTGKLHARGPVGLEGLVTYKYELTGNGDIVDDYAKGRKTFHHKDLM